MTPEEFIQSYLPTARAVEQGTGIEDVCLLAQWANETAWGTAWAGAPNNLGNIRCSPTSFCQYASLDDFAVAAIEVWHETGFINNQYPNGFEPFRAAAARALSSAGVLDAIIASPWDAGHYGGSLAAYYQPLRALLPITLVTGGLVVQMANVFHSFLRGADLALYHRMEQADGSLSSWTSLGGRLGSTLIAGGALSSGHLVITIDGAKTDSAGDVVPDGFKYDFVWDGSVWTGPTKNGEGTGMLVIGASSSGSGAAPVPKTVSGTFTGTVS